MQRTCACYLPHLVLHIDDRLRNEIEISVHTLSGFENVYIHGDARCALNIVRSMRNDAAYY